jgi:hypothetical protein
MLNFFQSLLDSKELISDLALALIIIIRADLEHPQKQSASVYRHYSDVITSLCRQMPEIYEQVVIAWRQRRPVLLPRPSTKQEVRPSETGAQETLLTK